MKIQFINVGADSMSWTANIPKLDHDSLYAAVKSRGALNSQVIDFSYIESANIGEVYVGRIRKVGTFNVVQEPCSL